MYRTLWLEAVASGTRRRKAYILTPESEYMTFPLFIGGLGPPELLLIVGILVLLFGASKLPDLARSMGSATGEFKKGRQEVEEELEDMQESDNEEVATEPEPEPETEGSKA
ncbi:MAG: sec-independent protein translocase protein TatA [Natronomonas sp.]